MFSFKRAVCRANISIRMVECTLFAGWWFSMGGPFGIGWSPVRFGDHPISFLFNSIHAALSSVSLVKQTDPGI